MTSLHDDGRFQVLRAKIETHLSEYRPKQYAELETLGKLQNYLTAQAEQAWEQMKSALESGHSPQQAEEFAYDLMYPDAEDVDDADELEEDPVEEWLDDRASIKIIDPTKTKD